MSLPPADTRWPAEALREEIRFDGRRMRCYAQRWPHLNAMLAQAVRRRPAASAIVDGNLIWSWRGVDTASRRLAGGLQRAGVQRGDRVLMLMGNRAEFILALHAVLRLGAVAVPVSIREAAPGVAYIVNQCQARAVLADAELCALPPAALDNGEPLLRVVAAGDGATPAGWQHARDLASGPPLARDAQPDEEDAAVILYTSGTTGRPKGAVLTHFNLVHSVLHYRHALGLTASDRALLAVPASHVTGLVAIVLAMAGVGGCTVVLREFKAAHCLQTLARTRVTYSLMVPAMYALCLREPALAQTDLSAWRLAGFGGAPMPPATIEALRSQCPTIRLFNAYGSTETTSPTTLTPPGSDRVDKVGIALPCAQVRVVDDEGRDVPAGTSGEVWIAGPMVVPRYWDNPQATTDGFVDGYWKSGDLGTLDEQGFLQIHDRKKDMINRGGYKVFSIEVENCLMAHPQVQEAATVGVPCPVLGERVHAFVYAPGTARNANEADALRAQLVAQCRAQLADYKTPDDFTWLAEPLPRNANGKVLKRALRERVVNR
ncbi:MAG: long-chain fatty acid--CoA ligase [Betaproteobacteria bacterium]|nr:long-chain fatty acid--CoA ligase [Betaproteobacteria bacterium]